MKTQEWDLLSCKHQNQGTGTQGEHALVFNLRQCQV